MAGRGQTVLPPPDISVVDVFEFIGANSVHLVNRKGEYWDQAFPPTSLHPVNVGTVSLSALFEGVGCWSMTNAAATINGRQGLARAIPIGADRSGDPAAALRPLKHTWEVLLIRPNPLIANTGFGYGFRRSNGLLGLDPTGIGVVVESITTVNAGRWTLYQRNLTGGARTATDLLIPGTTRLFLRFIYQDTTNPSLQVEANGVQVLNAVGLANLPQPVGAEILDNGFFQGDAGLAGVGGIDRVRQARYTMTLLPGFPADGA